MTCTPSNPCDPQDDLRYEIDGTCTNTPVTPDEGVDICFTVGNKADGCDYDKNPIVILPDAQGNDNNCFNTGQDFDQNIVLCFDYEEFDWSQIPKQIIKDIVLEDICCWVEECLEGNFGSIVGGNTGCGLHVVDDNLEVHVDGKTIVCGDNGLEVKNPYGGDGSEGDLCLVNKEQNLYIDDKGCLGFTQPEDGDPAWPFFSVRMYGHIVPDGPKKDAQAVVDWASPGPDGTPCVTINKAHFFDGEGGNIVWCVDLKFVQPLKTNRYEVFLTPGDGSYDHVMTYLKDGNPKQGFKVYMHDIENNVTAGDPNQPDGNHVAPFSFMVIF